MLSSALRGSQVPQGYDGHDPIPEGGTCAQVAKPRFWLGVPGPDSALFSPGRWIYDRYTYYPSTNNS